MKNQLIISLLILSVSTVNVTVQTSTITQIDQGDHKFAKGAILISLADTVSPEFIQYHFDRFGLKILQNDIRPVSGYTSLKLSPIQMEKLSSHPFILQIIVRDIGLTEERILDTASGKNPEDSLRTVETFRRMMSNPVKRIYFKHHITHEMAEAFAEQFPEFEIKIDYYVPKSVIVETIPGKEAEVIKKVEDLVYVQSTALIALQNEQ